MSLCNCSHIPGPHHQPWCLKLHNDDKIELEITFQRSSLIPGGNGALIAFSDQFPDKQFLIIPQEGTDDEVSSTNKGE